MSDKSKKTLFGEEGVRAIAGRLTAQGRLVTEDQIMRSLWRMRTGPFPFQFASFLGRHELTLFRLLFRYGWTTSPANPQGLLNAFDAVFQNWSTAHSVPQTDEMILVALPDGTAFIGPTSKYREALRELQTQRLLRTSSNIAGGPFGTLGYLLAGDAGSDALAFFDAVMQTPAQIREARAQFEVLSQPPPYRPEVALIEPKGTDNKAIEDSGTANPLSGPAKPKSPPQSTPSTRRPTSLPPKQGPPVPPSGGGQPPGGGGGGGQGSPGKRKPYVNLNPRATPEESSLGAWLDEQAQSGKLGLIKRVRGMPETPGRSGNPDYHLFFTNVDNAELNKLSNPQDLRGDALIAESKNIENIISEAGRKAPHQADVVFIEIGASGQSGQISDEAVRAWKLNDLKTTFPSLRRLVVIRNSGGVRNSVLDLEVR